MLFEPRFRVLEPIVREQFEDAKQAAGPEAASVLLELTDDTLPRARSRSAFLAFLPDGPVRITWAAVGTLWAASQATGRLSRQIFEKKRSGKECIQVEPGSPEEVGLLFLNLAQQLMRINEPAVRDGATVRWAILPDPS